MVQEQMQKRSILLTGASSGIGAALAREFAGPNTSIFLSARNEERLSAVAAQCKDKGSEVDYRSVDVTATQEIEKWISSVEESTDLDVVIANAGILYTCGPDGEVESAEDSIRQIETNLCGAIAVATAAVPHMQKRNRGHVVFVASLSGLQPVADVPGYSASKAGLVAYGEALGNFLHDQGILVSVICPGFISTPMTINEASFRPFELSAEVAAAKIRKAVDARKRFSAFPLPLVVLIRLGRFLPGWLRRITNKPFNFRGQE